MVPHTHPSPTLRVDQARAAKRRRLLTTGSPRFLTKPPLNSHFWSWIFTTGCCSHYQVDVLTRTRSGTQLDPDGKSWTSAARAALSNGRFLRHYKIRKNISIITVNSAISDGRHRVRHRDGHAGCVCAHPHTRTARRVFLIIRRVFAVGRRVFEREGGGPKDGCDALYVLRCVSTASS